MEMTAFTKSRSPAADSTSSRLQTKKQSSCDSMQIERMVELEMRRTNPGMIGKAKLNTIKITVALVGAFLACWTPYYVMCIW